jgi:MFS family permease
MMFFQDTRSIGLVFWIVVALLLFNAIAVILGGFIEDIVVVPDYVTDKQMFCLVIGIGSLLSAIIYGMNAHKVMSKKLTRLEVLRNYVMTVGICTTIGGVFSGLALYLFTNEPASGILIAVITIIIGLIVVGIASVLANGKKGFLKKVIWAILVIAFVLMALNALIEADNYWEFAEDIAHLLLAVFMLAFITDSDVRKEMGAKS